MTHSPTPGEYAVQQLTRQAKQRTTDELLDDDSVRDRLANSGPIEESTRVLRGRDRQRSYATKFSVIGFRTALHIRELFAEGDSAFVHSRKNKRTIARLLSEIGPIFGRHQLSVMATLSATRAVSLPMLLFSRCRLNC